MRLLDLAIRILQQQRIGAVQHARAAVAQRRRIRAKFPATAAGFNADDLDAAIRDPADPTRMKANLQSGDWLHPNDAGYRAMGDAIDLKLFH